MWVFCWFFNEDLLFCLALAIVFIVLISFISYELDKEQIVLYYFLVC